MVERGGFSFTVYIFPPMFSTQLRYLDSIVLLKVDFSISVFFIVKWWVFYLSVVDIPILQKLQWLQFIPCLQQEDFILNCYTDAVQSEIEMELQLNCVAVHCSTYFYESQCKWKVFHKYFKQYDSKFESMYPLFIYLL